MKKTNLIVTSLTCALIFSCAPKKFSQVTPDIDKVDSGGKGWGLNTAPNELDKVGVIFAVDENNKLLDIPGSSLNLKTKSGSVALSERTITKNVSFSTAINLLPSKNNYSANAKFNNTAILSTTFKLEKGIETRIDDNLPKAFEEKRAGIEATIKFLGLKTQKVYLILETIQSSNVSMTFDKSKNWGAELDAKMNEFASANPSVTSKGTNNSDLAYNDTIPLTFFYRLRGIDVFIDKNKETGTEKYTVSLGKLVNPEEIIIKRRE